MVTSVQTCAPVSGTQVTWSLTLVTAWQTRVHPRAKLVLICNICDDDGTEPVTAPSKNAYSNEWDGRKITVHLSALTPKSKNE